MLSLAKKLPSALIKGSAIVRFFGVSPQSLEIPVSKWVVRYRCTNQSLDRGLFSLSRWHQVFLVMPKFYLLVQGNP